MNVSHMSMELNAIRTRTRRLMAVSLGIHMLLLLWLMFMPKIVRESVTLTEITWLEPAPPPLPAVLTKTEPAREKQIPLQKPSLHDKRKLFRREKPEAAVKPEPQTLETVTDKLNERLAVLQKQRVDEPVKIAAQVSPSPVGKPTLAGLSTESPTPKEMTRRKTSGTIPIELNRTPKNIQQAATIATPLPERDVTPTTSMKTDNQAQRMLEGASLTGPVADRPLLVFCKPKYPDWAKREAVEGSVSIYFVVLPDGRIKDNIIVQKTSGFSDFDNNAIEALLTWRFEPIKKGQTGEQWGTITFHYRLSGS